MAPGAPETEGEPGAVPLPAPLAAFLERYRRGEYFESHEVREKAWLHSRSDFYPGLIILAAAFLRRARGTPGGAPRNLLKAPRCRAPYPPPSPGLDVERA